MTTQDKTGQQDIIGREICNGDIVEFNPIGSTQVLRGEVVFHYYDNDDKKEWKIKAEDNMFYGFDDIFGKAKVIRNI